jgi:hypothetical protein
MRKARVDSAAKPPAIKARFAALCRLLASRYNARFSME